MPSPFGVIVTEPRPNLVACTIHVAAVVRVTAIPTLAAATISVFVTFCHVDLLNLTVKANAAPIAMRLSLGGRAVEVPAQR
jgi:hypothetical protein